jgi:hypothetical protein
MFLWKYWRLVYPQYNWCNSIHQKRVFTKGSLLYFDTWYFFDNTLILNRQLFGLPKSNCWSTRWSDKLLAKGLILWNIMCILFFIDCAIALTIFTDLYSGRQFCRISSQLSSLFADFILTFCWRQCDPKDLFFVSWLIINMRFLTG